MDVSGGQIGVVVLNDLIERELLIDEFQNILCCYSRTCDARLSEVNPCWCGNRIGSPVET